MHVIESTDEKITFAHDGHTFYIYRRNMNSPDPYIGYYVEGGLFMPIHRSSIFGGIIKKFMQVAGFPFVGSPQR